MVCSSLSRRSSSQPSVSTRRNPHHIRSLSLIPRGVSDGLLVLPGETDETLALPAFENVNANSRGEVYANWLLWMVLFELNSLFAEASDLLADACQQITGAVLSIGVQGVAADDAQTLNLVLKFFNTFMRSGVNNGNIKLCCRVLNDYRKLIESIIRSGAYTYYPMQPAADHSTHSTQHTAHSTQHTAHTHTHTHTFNAYQRAASAT